MKDEKLVLTMKNVFHVTTLNILWQFITGTPFSHDDPKLSDSLEMMRKISKAYSLAGDILLAFPMLRHIVPRLTGYGMERRIFGEIVF